MEIQPLPTSFVTVGEVTEISHDKLLPIPEKSAFIWSSIIIFFLKPKIDLKDTDISKETMQKLLTLQQNYDDIVSKHRSDIRLTHLEEMTTDIDPNFPLLQANHILYLKTP